MPTKRQRLVSEALQAIAPMMPLSDVIIVKELAARPHMRGLPVERAVWLSVVTHVRHNHSDYHALLGEGYDRETARHFVVDEMNEVLRSWKSRRVVDGSEEAHAMPTNHDEAE